MKIHGFLLCSVLLISACAPIWQQQGYSSEEDFNFSKTLANATPKRVEELKYWGIKSKYDMDALIKEYKDARYSNDETYSTVFEYLKDRHDAKSANTTALKQKENRLKEENRKKEEFAKDYPFEAILSCGMGGRNIGNVAVCFLGGNSSGTELYLKNGESVQVYKGYELQELGQEQADGLHIPLNRSFTIKAQNDSKSAILTLTIKNTATGQVLNKQAAGMWDVVYMLN